MSLLPDQSKLIELAKAKMPYGKFKGRFLIDLPEHYIVWYKQKGFPKGKYQILCYNCNMAKAIQEKPTVIIANTIPGKGVSFMEDKFEWHGKPPKHEEAVKALKELRTLGGKIESEHE